MNWPVVPVITKLVNADPVCNVPAARVVYVNDVGVRTDSTKNGPCANP